MWCRFCETKEGLQLPGPKSLDSHRAEGWSHQISLRESTTSPRTRQRLCPQQATQDKGNKETDVQKPVHSDDQIKVWLHTVLGIYTVLLHCCSILPFSPYLLLSIFLSLYSSVFISPFLFPLAISLCMYLSLSISVSLYLSLYFFLSILSPPAFSLSLCVCVLLVCLCFFLSIYIFLSLS